MEILLDARKEVIEHLLVRNSRVLWEIVVLLVNVSRFVFDIGVVVFLREKIRHLSDGEDVIDVFDESLIDDLVV